jgi:hypothetical protein
MDSGIGVSSAPAQASSVSFKFSLISRVIKFFD